MTVMAWIGFAGGWLLVAGPLYQGAMELLEQEIDREGFQQILDGVAPPVMPSAWWWLLPPVMLVLRRRRNEAFRTLVRERFTPQQRVQSAAFLHKATGWLVVAAGASLIALKETWELAEHGHWPLWVYLLVVVVMFLAAAANTARGVARKRAIA